MSADRVTERHYLYKELHDVEAEMKPFSSRSASDAAELTQEQREHYASLQHRRDAIVEELAKLEGGHL
jgi:hypothetical protein